MHLGFQGLIGEKAAREMTLLESLFDLWQEKYNEVQTIAENQLSKKLWL